MTGTDAWTGKTVLIVGAAGGIGSATARAYHERRASLALADRDLRKLQSLNRELGNRHALLETDIRRPDACKRMIEGAIAAHGRLDILINAAGVWVEGPSETMTEEQWDRTLDINLKGTFFACRHAIPYLERTGGQIVNIASDAGLMGNAGAAVYCASKGGVVLLTKALALELAPRGVRVNAICPCDVDTPMLAFQATEFGGGDPEGYLARLKAIYPQGPRTRFATADEIAAFILAVAGLAPVTGAALPIDFGTTAGR
ncbi:MAG: SDR family oxidoreductase [Rhizobiales bacterium]|nr:SDR family oxidoreductase [Hyphomicrobiales bacterium]